MRELRRPDELPALVRGVADEDLVSLGAPEARLLSCAAEPLDEVIGRAKAIHQFLGTLRPRERRVIECRYGLFGERLTLGELGGEFGVQRERIRQIERTALRRGTRVNALREYGEGDDPDYLAPAEVAARVADIKERVAAERVRQAERRAEAAARLAAEEAAWLKRQAERASQVPPDAGLFARDAGVYEPPGGGRGPRCRRLRGPDRHWAVDTDYPGVTGGGPRRRRSRI